MEPDWYLTDYSLYIFIYRRLLLLVRHHLWLYEYVVSVDR